RLPLTPAPPRHRHHTGRDRARPRPRHAAVLRPQPQSRHRGPPRRPEAVPDRRGDRGRGRGVRITNRSSTHLLRVVMRGRTTDLPQTAAATPAASFVLVEGTVAVGSPTMHAEHQVLQVTVAPGEPDPRPGPLPATEETSTVGPWEIDTETRYLAVALALCQDRLENPAASGRVPTAKETTLAVLRLTHCHHHLGRIRAGDAATLGRLTKRVEDHLKYLRKLLRDKGQLPRGVEHLSKQS